MEDASGVSFLCRLPPRNAPHDCVLAPPPTRQYLSFFFVHAVFPFCGLFCFTSGGHGRIITIDTISIVIDNLDYEKQ